MIFSFNIVVHLLALLTLIAAVVAAVPFDQSDSGLRRRQGAGGPPPTYNNGTRSAVPNYPTSAINPFAPIATNAPPSAIPCVGGHPQSTTNIAQQNGPLHTNKFYANLFLGGQTNGIFTTPYVLTWGNGTGQTSSYGMAIAHSEADQKGFSDPNNAIPGLPSQFYINPLGIQSIVLSAGELGSRTTLRAEKLDTFSVNAVLRPSNSSTSSITLPLVQGMGFISGIYETLQPQVQSGVFYAKLEYVTAVSKGIYKWRIATNDQKHWLMYITPDNDTGSAPAFNLVSNSLIQGPANFSGTIQIAKNSASTDGEAVYDKSAGIYPISANLTGSVSGDAGSYTLTWTRGGKQNGQSLIQYALPHLVNSFDSTTKGKVVRNMTLQTTVKGVASAVVANNWTMSETKLPTNMGFAPWTMASGAVTNLSSTAINAIYAAAQAELQQDIVGQSNLNSMYYSGKALSKFATIIYAVNDLCRQPSLAQQGLATLKKAINIFTQNKQDFPLYYDTVWKGVVSSASYNGGDAGADFGNTYYNDHHFHYGYFLHAAAIVGYLDSTWLTDNKDWVNALARDVANPSYTDSYFPVFRSFDWYNGHSMAKGLFDSGDGKDEESTSEDVMFSYGLKMWGKIVGDASMEARGNLMLAVLARSLESYFLMESNNVNQPSKFIANKAAGITFENKVDHTTYFGGNYEYVEGIHMLPLTPASVLTRSKSFVREEWQSYFAVGAITDVRNVIGGWKGVLYANSAIIDPVTSFNFFNSSNFDNSWLDGGASKTWYLAFAAGLGGA